MELLFDANDLHSLALCAWKEARGEGPLGMDAVMHVINNRVGKPGFGKTLHDCIFGKNQFTSMSVPSDPEFNLMPISSDKSFDSALQDAADILSGKLTDMTHGAVFYANLKNIQQGGWFERNIVSKYPITLVLGHHTFYGPMPAEQVKVVDA
jgi:spore germination cell wall hydrolase CwlJ-like protein